MPARAKSLDILQKGSPNMPAGANKLEYFVKGLL